MSKVPHFVAEEEYDPHADRQMLDRSDLDAPTRVLVWRRFRRHKLGMFCAGFLALIYLMLPFMEMIAPYDPNRFDEENTSAPPQGLYFFDDSGEFIGPYTHPTETVYDIETGTMKTSGSCFTPSGISYSRQMPMGR